jgi:DNA-binding FadR family transcriptional regulator
MKFDAIRIHSAPEALVEEIIKQIVSGALPPGTCLPSQRQLAKLFQVGLGSVREAIKILHVMGYLVVNRGKGTFVAEKLPSGNEADPSLHKALEAVSLADLMRAREIVECACAGLAAEAADEENIKRLHHLTEAMESSFHDTKAFFALDFDFHMAVAEATNNKALFEIVKLLVNRAHDHIGFMEDTLSISMPINVERAVETARRITDWIATGDRIAAEQEMGRHLNIVNWELEKKFPGEAGKSPPP